MGNATELEAMMDDMMNFSDADITEFLSQDGLDVDAMDDFDDLMDSRDDFEDDDFFDMAGDTSLDMMEFEDALW